jgi:hypothetical protein
MDLNNSKGKREKTLFLWAPATVELGLAHQAQASPGAGARPARPHSAWLWPEGRCGELDAG